jgi:hypothetical protein
MPTKELIVKRRKGQMLIQRTNIVMILHRRER